VTITSFRTPIASKETEWKATCQWNRCSMRGSCELPERGSGNRLRAYTRGMIERGRPSSRRVASALSLASAGSLGVVLAVVLTSCGTTRLAGATQTLVTRTTPTLSVPERTTTAVVTTTRTVPPTTVLVTTTEVVPTVTHSVTTTATVSVTQTQTTTIVTVAAPPTVTTVGATTTVGTTTSGGVSPAGAAAAGAAIASKNDQPESSGTEWSWIVVGIVLGGVIVGAIVWWGRRGSRQGPGNGAPPSTNAPAM